jgi:hypothetical protein
MCEIDMQVSSSSYMVFNSSSTGYVDTAVSNEIPDSTGTASYVLHHNSIEITNSFAQAETGRKGVCFNPKYSVVGVQAFIAFNIPVVIPSAVEVWLSGTQKIAARVTGARVLELIIGQQCESTAISLNVNMTYVLLFAIDNSAGILSSQIVTAKNEPVATLELFIANQDITEALLTEQFNFCIALASTAARRVHSKDVSVQVNYYGTQNVSTAGTIVTKQCSLYSISGASIAGAVIGSLIAACVI